LPVCENLNQSFDFYRHRIDFYKHRRPRAKWRIFPKEQRMAPTTPDLRAPRARRKPRRRPLSKPGAPRALAVDPALKNFYAEDARRERSRELDFGLRWRALDQSTYRAAWIADTGELYTVRHGAPAEASRVTVLARLGADRLERALKGWREVLDTGEPGTYEWLRARARAAA
jgi:hypothetical protein